MHFSTYRTLYACSWCMTYAQSRCSALHLYSLASCTSYCNMHTVHTFSLLLLIFVPSFPLYKYEIREVHKLLYIFHYADTLRWIFFIKTNNIVAIVTKLIHFTICQMGSAILSFSKTKMGIVSYIRLNLANEYVYFILEFGTRLHSNTYSNWCVRMQMINIYYFRFDTRSVQLMTDLSFYFIIIYLFNFFDMTGFLSFVFI